MKKTYLKSLYNFIFAAGLIVCASSCLNKAPGQLPPEKKQALVNQILRCWQPLAGIEGNNSRKLSALITLAFNKDGSLKDIAISEQVRERYNENIFFRAFLESAVSAVHDCTPLNPLPSEDYALWKKLQLEVRPLECSHSENAAFKCPDHLKPDSILFLPEKAFLTRKESSEYPVSVADSIRQQIMSCWNPPAFEKGLFPSFGIAMHYNPDGTLQRTGLEPAYAELYHKDTRFKVLADSAMRAVRACSPLKDMPPEKYNAWKDMEIIFDLSGY